jgi:uncharacterized protein YlxP (DUF503 family)
MNIGACRIDIHLPESQSLKDKRRIIKSIITRLQNEFRISVAEVENLDTWQVATIGITCVSNHSGHAGDIINNAIDFIIQNYPQVQITNHETEIIPAF